MDITGKRQSPHHTQSIRYLEGSSPATSCGGPHNRTEYINYRDKLSPKFATVTQASTQRKVDYGKETQRIKTLGKESTSYPSLGETERRKEERSFEGMAYSQPRDEKALITASFKRLGTQTVNLLGDNRGWREEHFTGKAVPTRVDYPGWQGGASVGGGPSGLVSKEELEKEEVQTQTHTNGTGSYEGDVQRVGANKQGWVPHGEGVKTWRGSSLIGGEQRHDGKAHSMGSMAGNTYTGTFADGRSRAGAGVMAYADGTTYEGQWEAQMRNGAGVFTWVNGTKYTGEWADDKICGEGLMEYTELSICGAVASYQGTFKPTWKRACANGRYTISGSRRTQTALCGCVVYSWWLFSWLVRVMYSGCVWRRHCLCGTDAAVRACSAASRALTLT
jgi:hypothetical protein